jgi:hypothetical protein
MLVVSAAIALSITRLASGVFVAEGISVGAGWVETSGDVDWETGTAAPESFSEGVGPRKNHPSATQATATERTGTTLTGEEDDLGELMADRGTGGG